MIRRLLCWLGWHEWGCVCSLYKNCQRIKTLKCRVFNIRCKHCGKERDEIYNFSGEESMIRRILCWLGWHDWRYVIKFEKMCSGVIWYDKPYLDGKVCKHCGKVKR